MSLHEVNGEQALRLALERNLVEIYMTSYNVWIMMAVPGNNNVRAVVDPSCTFYVTGAVVTPCIAPAPELCSHVQCAAVRCRLHYKVYRKHSGESVRLAALYTPPRVRSNRDRPTLPRRYSAVMTAFHRVYGDLRPVAMVSATQHDGSRTASSDAAEPAAAVPSHGAGASPRGAASTSSDSDDDEHSSPTTARLGAKRLYTLFHARNAACVVGPALAAYMLLA